jgi:hypothetical protein
MTIAKLFASADDIGPALMSGFKILRAIAAMKAQHSDKADRLSERFVRVNFRSISTASLFKWR